MNSNPSVKEMQIIRPRTSKKRQKPCVEAIDNITEDLNKDETGLINKPTPEKHEKNILPTSSSHSAKGYSLMNKTPTTFKKHPPTRNPRKGVRRCLKENNVRIAKTESKLKDEIDHGKVEIFKVSDNEITNFSLRKLENKLYSLISCRSCKLFFDAKREPRLYLHNENACTDCICKMSRLSENYVKMQFPLNYSYVSAVPLILKMAGISCSETIFVDEFTRALKNKCKQQYVSRKLFTVMQQNMHHISDVIDFMDNEVADEHCDHTLTVLETMGSLEKCKNVIARPHNSDKLVNSFNKTIVRLDRYNFFCGAPNQKINDIDDVSLYKHALMAYPVEKSTEFSITLLENILFDGLELFAFIDVNHWRLYSKVKVSKGMFFLASFLPKFPSMSSFRIGNFIRFEVNSVKNAANGYFEIPVAITENVKDAPISTPRFFILFGFVDFSWHVASLFLGNNGYSVLGSEIEVTEETIIFKYFPLTGIIPERIHKRFLKRIRPEPIREGMAVVEVEDKICKLIIYRCGIPTKLIKFVVGVMHKFSLLQFKKFPLGMYKITSCGINIIMDDRSRPMLPT